MKANQVYPFMLYLRQSAAAALFLLFSIVTSTAVAQEKAEDKPQSLIVDRVVAVVNDDIILSTELMTRVAPMAFELNKISDPKERARRQAKLSSEVLDQMINEQLVSQAAKEAKLEVSAKEVEAAIADLKRQNKLDDEQLKEALRLQGSSMSTYRRDVRNQILRMRAVSTIVRPKVNITEDDIRARYDAMARRSAQVSEVHLQHILIATPPKADEATLSAARAKAAEVITKAKAGEDFGKLAQTYSDDPSTKNTGGDLGWIERGTIATEWEVIVFAMGAGEVRGPINGPRGLHVFRVSEVKDSKQEPFNKVKEQIRNELYRTELERQNRLWQEELRKKAHFEILL
jgi:parvulin-like peptidyl-prolyl isomerase